jgi:Transposase
LPAFQKLALTLLEHLEGLLAYCKHKVPFGVVETINGNLRNLIRRARGYQDHEYLILKAQRSTAQATRSGSLTLRVNPRILEQTESYQRPSSCANSPFHTSGRGGACRALPGAPRWVRHPRCRQRVWRPPEPILPRRPSYVCPTRGSRTRLNEAGPVGPPASKRAAF